MRSGFGAMQGARTSSAVTGEPMVVYLWIAFGSALGGLTRFGLSLWIAGGPGGMFPPLGTLVANATGSFVIGFFATISGPDGRVLISPDIRQFVLVGFCGGYTTFSTFSLQTLDLLLRHAPLVGGLNILLSVVLCLLFVWLGYLGATALNMVRPFASADEDAPRD